MACGRLTSDDRTSWTWREISGLGAEGVSALAAAAAAAAAEAPFAGPFAPFCGGVSVFPSDMLLVLSRCSSLVAGRLSSEGERTSAILRDRESLATRRKCHGVVVRGFGAPVATAGGLNRGVGQGSSKRSVVSSVGRVIAQYAVWW